MNKFLASLPTPKPFKANVIKMEDMDLPYLFRPGSKMLNRTPLIAWGMGLIPHRTQPGGYWERVNVFLSDEDISLTLYVQLSENTFMKTHAAPVGSSGNINIPDFNISYLGNTFMPLPASKERLTHFGQGIMILEGEQVVNITWGNAEQIFSFVTNIGVPTSDEGCLTTYKVRPVV